MNNVNNVNKEMGRTAAFAAFCMAAMVGANAWSCAAAPAWPEHIAPCVTLIAVGLVPLAIYRAKRPVPCIAR